MYRNATLDDLPQLIELFLQTIRSVNTRDYSAEQVQAWSTGVKNHERWKNRVLEQHLILDEEAGILRGFASITTDGYIDLMYVNKDFQGRGVAKNLYFELEKFARKRGIGKLESDVSITARPFFERMGFKVVKEQTVLIQGVSLTNYKMNKSLNDEPKV